MQNFLGLAIGPTVFALVAAGFFGGDRGLVSAMMLCYVGFAALASATMYALMLERRRQRTIGNPAFALS